MIQYLLNKYKHLKTRGGKMDIQPQEVKPIIDDQELAKVLAGVTNTPVNDFNYEETPISAPTAPAQVDETVQASAPQEPVVSQPLENQLAQPVAPMIQTPQSNSGDLETIKKDALKELRPLVEKLELSAEEKFDIYLLLLRSTDDTTLIAPAHATAQQIEDESKRAQALLDIIKEIDFLSAPL
jgi:hypothetical protein